MILLAEDSQEDLGTVRAALQDAGVNNPIYVISDGEQAVAYLEGSGVFADRQRYPFPNVLLLDLRLPRISGFEVLERLRNCTPPRKPLVVVLSGSEDIYNVSLAYALGAHSVLTKPCNPLDVQNLIRTYRTYWQCSSEVSEAGAAMAGRH